MLPDINARLITVTPVTTVLLKVSVKKNLLLVAAMKSKRWRATHALYDLCAHDCLPSTIQPGSIPWSLNHDLDELISTPFSPVVTWAFNCTRNQVFMIRITIAWPQNTHNLHCKKYNDYIPFPYFWQRQVTRYGLNVLTAEDHILPGKSISRLWAQIPRLTNWYI